MPRFSNEGPAVNEWYEANGGREGSSTHDVCRRCIDRVDELEPYGHEEPKGDWLDTECHPDYGDDEYRCAVCGCVLDERRDG